MKRMRWFPLILVVMLLAACSGQTAQIPTAPASPSGEVFQIALPRLIIDFDSDGVPSVMGISPLFLKALGVDVAGLKVPAATIDTLRQAGVQHIEVAAVGDRLVFFVNGAPMPELGWDEASLQRALDLARVFDVQNVDLISKLMPWVTRLGLDVVLRFPHDGAEIALTEPGAAKQVSLTPHTDPAAVIIKFEVRFDEEGVPAVLGLSTRDLATLGVTGMSSLAPEMLGKLQAHNVQHLELRTKPDGVHIYSNGEPLPTIMWDSQLLANLVDVWGKVAPTSAFWPVVQALFPTLDRADVGILVHFPVAAGQTPISVKMHE